MYESHSFMLTKNTKPHIYSDFDSSLKTIMLKKMFKSSLVFSHTHNSYRNN